MFINIDGHSHQGKVVPKTTTVAYVWPDDVLFQSNWLISKQGSMINNIIAKNRTIS